MGAGLLVYRGYAANLLRMVKSRALVPTELVLDDSSSLAVVERLVHSDRLYEVHLGLDMLLTADQATWRDELIALAVHPNPEIRRESLRRIEERRVKEALPQVEQNMRGTAIPGCKALLSVPTPPSTKAISSRPSTPIWTIPTRKPDWGQWLVYCATGAFPVCWLQEND